MSNKINRIMMYFGYIAFLFLCIVAIYTVTDYLRQKKLPTITPITLYEFGENGTLQYQLEQSRIIQIPSWIPGAPLPYSVNEALERARDYISEEFPDINADSLFPFAINLNYQTANRWSYRIEFLRAAKVSDDDRIGVQVLMDGTVWLPDSIQPEQSPRSDGGA